MSRHSPTIFGYLSDGRAVTEYTLANNGGIVAKILDYGGIVRSLQTPDRHGKLDDIVLGFDTLAPYEGKHPYFGAIVGRVAGRIGGGRLNLNGVEYQLTVNEPPNHLHGGAEGFHRKLWDASFCEVSQSLTLCHTSLDGEEGFPGELRSQVSYRLTDDNELIVSYRASADVPTVVNLTQHSYFNLSGKPDQAVLDHRLSVKADAVLELDENQIPTGSVQSVSGTDFDLRSTRRVGEYDHYWVLPRDAEDDVLKFAAELCHEQSGRVLQVLTTAPGLQVYSGAGLPAGLVGKAGLAYGPSCGICLETQVHPDSPNHPNFPGIVIDSGADNESTTVFRFLAGD